MFGQKEEESLSGAARHCGWSKTVQKLCLIYDSNLFWDCNMNSPSLTTRFTIVHSLVRKPIGRHQYSCGYTVKPTYISRALLLLWLLTLIARNILYTISVTQYCIHWVFNLTWKTKKIIVNSKLTDIGTWYFDIGICPRGKSIKYMICRYLVFVKSTIWFPTINCA